MIYRLRKVTDGLYRGSAPTPQDVVWLKEKLGINKIVSLDQVAGEAISRTCKLLGINQVKIYIDETNLSVAKLLKHNLKKLLLEDGPTFVHCHEGKDRTGLVAALVQCKYLGMKPQDALEEAKALGFGIDADPRMIKLFEKLILNCKPATDSNDADIVSQEREYVGDNRDSFLDEGHQGSFSPFLSKTRQNPMDEVFNFLNDQSPTRENYHQYKHPEVLLEIDEENVVPQVGLFNNDSGGRGWGPVENPGGFFYD